LTIYKILFLLFSLLFLPIQICQENSQEVIIPYEDILNESIRTIDPSKPMVAITFDDGPFYKHTTMILDTLKEYNARATFFVLGDHVENNPEILERMILEGHEIGNHTYSHYQLTSISENLIKDEIEKTQEVIYSVIKQYPSVLRPPYGDYNETVMNHLGEMRMVKWNVDSEDWRSKNTKVIVEKVMSDVKDKAIILLHDQYITTVQATAILIPKLIEEGYQLVTVSELYSFE